MNLSTLSRNLPPNLLLNLGLGDTLLNYSLVVVFVLDQFPTFLFRSMLGSGTIDLEQRVKKNLLGSEIRFSKPTICSGFMLQHINEYPIKSMGLSLGNE